MTGDQSLNYLCKCLLITQHVNNNPRRCPVINLFHAAPPRRDLCSPYNVCNAGSSSHFSFGSKQKLNTSQVHPNKLAQPHMTHLSFLPNMARNRMPGCPLAIPHYPAFLRAACRGRGREAGVRLAQGQVTVIDRRMIDGCS